MVKDAEAHAEEDKKRRELVEARNQAEALVHSTEKAVAEHGAKVGEAETKTAIETALADLKSALDRRGRRRDPGEEPGAAAGFHEARRGDVQGEPGGARRRRPAVTATAAPPAPASGEDVVDADFEEIPEDERKRSA